ncbi:protein lethal(2)denticleless [Anopheles nili]|uniref:protein lethal(2)denticleless n=1 Tax=Anopheles nili TaxID=185578 RepID=UPI00237A7C23|nr:protein lethal(2)denticleless [Anopheles nili]
MNTVQNFVRRESGRGFSRQYDVLLLRMHVHERDSWKGITPSELSLDFNPSPPILAAKFSKRRDHEHILAIANEDGKIALQDTNLSNSVAGGERALEGMQCHNNAVFDLEWMPGEAKLVTASGDHTAQLWTLTESEMVSTQTFHGHSRSVKTVAFRQDDSAVFATGGRDGAIMIWDIRAQPGMDMLPRADNCIFSAHAGGPGTPASHRKRSRLTPKIPAQGCSSSITGLVFQDGNTLISCGAGDGMVKVWDTRRHYTSHLREAMPKHYFAYAGTTALKGFTNLAIDEQRHRLYVNCMDNYIYCYNISSYDDKPLQRYGGFNNGTFYVKAALSPDGQYLISGSSDERCYIWNVDNGKPLVKLAGHSAEVTSVAWMQSERDVRIVTCSDDARHKIWRIGPEEIDSDDLHLLRGSAEYCDSYRLEPTHKLKLKALDFTPKSVRGFVRRNETTPSMLEDLNRTPKASDAFATAGSNSCSRPDTERSGKRTYSEMAKTEGHVRCPPVKRPYREEGRGRRLFSPLNTKSPLCITALEIAASSSSSRSLNVILEASDELQADASPCKSPLATANIILRSPEPTLEHRCASPTLNVKLPNYVLDGEAPHLVNVIAASFAITDGSSGSGVGAQNDGSPSGGVKRKMKERLDWLTKIRKQKQMQSVKGIENSYGTLQEKDTKSSGVLSPRLQQMKACDGGALGTNGESNCHQHLHQHHHLLQENTSANLPHLQEKTSGTITETPTTPRRRSSWSRGCNSPLDEGYAVAGEDDLHVRGVVRTPRTRRYSMNGVRGSVPVASESASIRRFLTVTTPTSRANAQTSS